MDNPLLVLFLILLVIAECISAFVLIYFIYMDKRKNISNGHALAKFKRFGIYTLFKRIGRGGYADIYLATKKDNNHQVAVKILKSQKDKDSIKRLLVEGESIQKINTTHPESPVVKVHEFGREKTTGQYYIAMDYLDGQNLKHILETDIHIGLHHKLFIIKEVAKALRDSHDLDIYHSDVSPENIVIDHKGKKVTLIDFGIAREKISRIHTITNMILGTLAYASPEQCTAGTITGKSDIYSLGAVFFYMLEGKPPFYSVNVYDLIACHQSQPVPEMKAPVPKELKQFIYSMLAKQPEERPDAREVIEKMREFLNKFKGSSYENFYKD